MQGAGPKMLVVSFRGVNWGFWCQGVKEGTVNGFTHKNTFQHTVKTISKQTKQQ